LSVFFEAFKSVFVVFFVLFKTEAFTCAKATGFIVKNKKNKTKFKK